ncbi:GNAT family N-acetyltransferase [Roseibium sp.]|uniref:GNAT family N-acetyltransferase n=1 Tax=Roseibium sp. TaxID=1936156 RepID=UPI003D10EEED
MNPPVLTTERLRLVPFRECDLPLLADLHSDPEVNRYLSPGPVPMSEAEVRRRLATYISDHQLHGISKWKLETLEGDFIGRAGFSYLDCPAGIEMGYSLKRAAWGQGYATEIAGGLVEWFFQNTVHDILTAYAFMEHKASQKVMLKCGFCHWRDMVKHGAPCSFYRICREDLRQANGISRTVLMPRRVD